PRFFEAFMVGRRFDEIAEIASRICGICYVTHQITPVRAIEKILGVEVNDRIKLLRRLIAIGGIISSHALHVYLLALPDVLKLPNSFSIDPKLLVKALKLKGLGDKIVEIVGGRAVHPVTIVVGGFTYAPPKEKLNALVDDLKDAKKTAMESIQFFSSESLPSFEADSEKIALSNSDEYAINEGRVKSNKGLDISEDEFRKFIEEEQVPHSTAKHSKVKGRLSYMVGPLSRVNLNFHQLNEDAQNAAETSGFKFPSCNPFVANVARVIEMISLIDEAIELIDLYNEGEVRVSFKVRGGNAAAITEAPRGINYHWYSIDNNGVVKAADISPPTCQNARRIEDDLRAYVPTIAELSKEEIAHRCSMLIRAYDPCISCSVHSLNVKVRKT
ncbi:Ni/Fe hydrogenase subunit alpha, partial [Candidatus Bathyarchaeota archaeon]|nr:Ni/Fe hydrogenase subunit alpha [Candidatus Bathyarchaeota archaeon]